MKQSDRTYVWGQDDLARVLLASQKDAPQPSEVERFSLYSVANGVILELWLRPEARPSPLIESLKAEEAKTAPGAYLERRERGLEIDRKGPDPETCPDPVHGLQEQGIDASTDEPAPEIDPPEPRETEEAEEPAALYHLLNMVLPYELTPHIRQIRAWTTQELGQVSGWARNARRSPGACMPSGYPACLTQAVAERKAENERLLTEESAPAKNPRKKRAPRA